MRLLPAAALELSTLRELFNEGFSDYQVPLRMDETAFRAHLDGNDIDLAYSHVVVDGRPAAFALIARRGEAAWVGGMGTAPAYRRRGLGERALVAGLDAAGERGCRDAWLEVIDTNQAPIRLYEKLGFEAVRELIVWSLRQTMDLPPGGRPVDAGQAHAWIAAHRRSREPWQRADESLAKIRRGGAPLRGLVVEDAGEILGAAVVREHAGVVVVLQITADDDAVAAELLLAAAGSRELRLANAPAGEPASRALERLGARVTARQHEMRLRLAGHHSPALHGQHDAS